MTYYGPGPYPQGPPLYNNRGPKPYETPYIRADYPQDLAEIVERTAKLDHNWEMSKIRWACAGHRITTVDIEMERLEFGKPWAWDPPFYSFGNQDPRVHVSLAQIFPNLVRSKEDRKRSA